MTLTVLSVAFPFAPVGPYCVGGAEQILTTLDRALAAAGHRSLVVACRGSQAAGTLFAAPPPQPPVLDESSQAATRTACQSAVDRALASCPVDLVHMHCLDFHRYRLPAGVPTLVTLHLPIAWYPREIWTEWRHRARFCCVSHSQRRTCPPKVDAEVIPNGVVMPPLLSPSARQGYAVVLARICPEKNAHSALEAGTRAGIRVLLAGQVFPYPEHLRYFHELVEPLLDPARNPLGHRYLGPVDARQRQHLLAGARCLLHPTLAPETSSLAAMEALAAGIPVIAYPSGALPEIVDDGVTGFLAGDVGEMARAIARTSEISRQACCAAAEQRFHADHMIRSYFDLYHAMARQSQPLQA